jgi:predicted nucleotidyltransferase
MLCTLASPGRQAVSSTEAPRRAVTLDEVRAHRDVILRLGQRFGVRNTRVFGSVARGEATPGSDLDLLVDVDCGRGYFDMAGFALGVEDELGVMTQVATLGRPKLRIHDRVLRPVRRDDERLADASVHQIRLAKAGEARGLHAEVRGRTRARCLTHSGRPRVP